MATKTRRMNAAKPTKVNLRQVSSLATMTNGNKIKWKIGVRREEKIPISRVDLCHSILSQMLLRTGS